MSEPLFQHLGLVGERVRQSPHLLLFLDFDGTLAPIVADPAAARLPPDTRDVLAWLSRRPGVTIAIISGRSLEDLRARIGLDLIYAGNHGLEIEGPGFELREPRAEALQEALRTLCERLARDLEPFPGAIVEYKRLTASVHFRQVPPPLHGEMGQIVSAALESVHGLFAGRTGKMVFEIRPGVRWHKGSAVRWIRRRYRPLGALPVCIGDDVTDEDAFAALPDGITVSVGSCPSLARYRVADPREVRDFLRWLAPFTHRPREASPAIGLRPFESACPSAAGPAAGPDPGPR